MVLGGTSGKKFNLCVHKNIEVDPIWLNLLVFSGLPWQGLEPGPLLLSGGGHGGPEIEALLWPHASTCSKSLTKNGLSVPKSSQFVLKSSAKRKRGARNTWLGNLDTVKKIVDNLAPHGIKMVSYLKYKTLTPAVLAAGEGSIFSCC